MKTVVHYTDSVAFGGAEEMVLTLMQGLDRDRWRPVLLYHATPATEVLAAEARQRSIDVVPVAPLRSVSDPVAVARIARVLRHTKADVFHAHLAWALRCTPALLAAFVARVPHRVATQHLIVPSRRYSRRLRQRAIATVVDRYIAVSDAVAHGLRRSMVPEAKLRVVRNGINIARFDRACGTALRADLSRAPFDAMVLTIARLDPQKALQNLITAAEQLPRVVFIIAGEGAERGRLEAEVARRGLCGRVLLIGQRSDVPDLLAACDAFVLPSLFEGLPVSVLEAMAARKPVIASAVAGTLEAVVDGETGVLVPAGNANALAAAVRRVTSDAAFARRLGMAGRGRVERDFSARSMVSAVERVYDQLFDSRWHLPFVKGVRAADDVH